MDRLTREPIDARALCDALVLPQDGAVVAFEGIVRNHSRGKTVAALEYHAYESMAARKLEEVCALARRDFAVRDIGIVHRLGRLQPGDCSVVIVVVSAHRAPAFEACRFAIDSLKRMVPIWKKEIYDDGECWAESGN
ncbi:MAG: molybdenum cofactor biosynthesis protein MoaE [Acidobacteria bacterium]|nr:molybdenum cofactor biosynthesis protein MoaE [Acidobacteriota bacterium]